MKLNARLDTLKDQAAQAVTFLFSIAFASVVSALVFPRADNPYGIAGGMQMGLETNYLRLIGLAALTLLTYWVLRRLSGREWLFRGAIVLIAGSVIFTTDFVRLLDRQIDTFHYGEQMSAAAANAGGKELYSDIFVVHGAGEDVLMPRLAYETLSGGKQSIGSYLVFTELLRGLAVLALFGLVALLARGRFTFLASSLWLAGSFYGAIAYPKHLLLYLGVTLIYLFLCRTYARSYIKPSLLILLGLLSAGGLFYSVDVGVVLTALVLAAAAVLPFVIIKDSTIRFGRPTALKAVLPSLYLLGGAGLGHLLLLAGLGASKYASFLQLTFVELPRYQTMLFSFRLPDFEAGLPSYGIWLPFVLVPVILLLAFRLVRTEFMASKRLSARLAFLIIVLGTGLVMLRFALARPDFGHMADASPLFFIASLLLIEHYGGVVRTASGKRLVEIAWAPCLFLLLLIWPISTWDISRTMQTRAVSKQDLAALKNLPRKSDRQWMNPEQNRVVDYIQANTTPEDPVYVYTSEPLYYYLLKRPNPSRFALNWFADPKPNTDILLHDLESSKPKYVIYSGPTPYDTIDGIQLRDRIPEIDDWIRQNYTEEIKLGDTVVRKRNEP